MDKVTVLDKVLQECNEAFYSHVPILYLLTEETELADQIVSAQTMVELLKFLPDGTLLSYDRYRESMEKQGKVPEVPDNDRRKQLPRSQNYTAFRSPELFVFKNYTLLDQKESELAEFVDRYVADGNGGFLKRSVVLLCSPVLQIPTGLEPYVQVIEVPYPEDFEIDQIIREFNQKKYQETLSEDYINRLVLSMKGFRKSTIENILERIIGRAGRLSNLDKKGNKEEKMEGIVFEIVKEMKKQALKKTGVLRLKKQEPVFVGGLKELKKWIYENKMILEHRKEAEEWGIHLPKGMLFCGIPGSGKSLTAKLVAQVYGDIPLIELDMGSLMGKYLGESEARIRKALAAADALAPCVLFIDEMEKAFSGTSGEGDAGGTAGRGLATFLTWMQERTAPCFIFATSNRIEHLPPELLRSGRFDRKFYVFMPMRAECIEIFQETFKNIQVASKDLFSPDIVNHMDLFEEILDYCVLDGRKKFLTGSDINSVVQDAIKGIFIARSGGAENFLSWSNYKISEKELKNAMKKAIDCTRTYGETNMADIAKCFLRLYQNKFVPASGEDPERILISFEDFKPQEVIPIQKSSDRMKNKYDKILFEEVKEAIHKEWAEKEKH